MITVTLHANKSADLTYYDVTVENDENYKIVEGENLATKVKIIYPIGYEQQAKYVTMKNARGEFATVVLEGNGREYEIDIPGTMTYPGNIILVCVAGTANSSGTPKTVWLPVSMHVEATGVNCAKIAQASPDLILQCIAIATRILDSESSRVTAEQGRVTAEQERVTAEQGRVIAEEAREEKVDEAYNASIKATAAVRTLDTLTLTVETLPPGAPASGTVTKGEDSLQFNFSIPQGVKGDTGEAAALVANKSVNLYLSSSDTVGKWITSDGTLASQSGYSTTKLLKVTGAQKIVAKYMIRLAFYDEDGLFITGSYKTATSSVPLSEVAQDVPAGAAYARISFYTANSKGQYVKTAAELGEYIPYGLPTLKDDNGADVKAHTAERLSNGLFVRRTADQMYDPAGRTPETIIAGSGNTSYSQYFFTTDFIPVAPGGTVYISEYRYFAEYDEAKKLIPGSYRAESADAAGSVTVGARTAFIRLSARYQTAGSLLVTTGSGRAFLAPTYAVYGDGDGKKLVEIATKDDLAAAKSYTDAAEQSAKNYTDAAEQSAKNYTDAGVQSAKSYADAGSKEVRRAGIAAIGGLFARENLYYPAADTAGKWVTSDGTLDVQNGYVTTGMIKVAPSGKIVAKYMARIAFYDGDGVFVPGSYKSGALSEIAQDAPADACFARISFYTANSKDQYIKLSSGIGDYVPYAYPTLKDDNGSDVCADMAKRLENSLDVRNTGLVLYDKNLIVTGKQVVSSGAVSTAAGKFTTGFMRVTAGTTVHISSMTSYAEYDLAKRYVPGSYDGEAKTDAVKTTGAYTAYIRVSALNTGAESHIDDLVVSTGENTPVGTAPTFAIYDENGKAAEIATKGDLSAALSALPSIDDSAADTGHILSAKGVDDRIAAAAGGAKYLKNYQLTAGTVIDSLNGSGFTGTVFPGSYYRHDTKAYEDHGHMVCGPSLGLKASACGYVEEGTFTAGETLPEAVSGVSLTWYSDAGRTAQITVCPAGSPKIYYRIRAAKITARKACAFSLGDDDLLTFWLYVSDVRKSSELSFLLYSGGAVDAAHTAAYQVFSNKLEIGWNLIPVMKSDFTAGNAFSFADVTGIGFYAKNAPAAAEFCASVADLRIGRTFEPKIIFRFDDALLGVRKYAQPLLAAKGWSGITYANAMMAANAQNGQSMTQCAINRYYASEKASGKILASDGSLTNDADYTTSGYIDLSYVENGATEYCERILPLYAVSIAFYTKSGNDYTFLSGSYREHSEVSPISGVPVTVPEGAQYARVSFPKSAEGAQTVRVGKVFGYDEVYCTTDQLKEMYDARFDVGNHSYSHLNFDDPGAYYDSAEYPSKSVLYQIRECQRWLIREGFVRSAKHFAVPGGHDNDLCQEALDEVGMQTSTNSNTGVSMPVCGLHKIQSRGVHGEYKDRADGSTVPYHSPATVYGWVEDAVKRGQTLVFMFHDVVEDYDLKSDPKYQYKASDFADLLDRIENGGYGKYVVSMSDWYNSLHRDARFD